MARVMTVTFKKGPLGYAVLKDGVPVGRIRRYERGVGAGRLAYLIRIKGHTFPPTPGGLAAAAGLPNFLAKIAYNIRDAKRIAREALAG